MIIAIDPGSAESALIGWDGEKIHVARKEENALILKWLSECRQGWPLVIEKVACYGMPVGEEIFETVYWSGRFAQAYGAGLTQRVKRMEVKMHLCHTMKAKDGNIRQALIDRFGAPGVKKAPGLLYGMSGDLWAALALAVTVWDLKNGATSHV